MDDEVVLAAMLAKAPRRNCEGDRQAPRATVQLNVRMERVQRDRIVEAAIAAQKSIAAFLIAAVDTYHLNK